MLSLKRSTSAIVEKVRLVAPLLGTVDPEMEPTAEDSSDHPGPMPEIQSGTHCLSLSAALLQ